MEIQFQIDKKDQLDQLYSLTVLNKLQIVSINV